MLIDRHAECNTYSFATFHWGGARAVQNRVSVHLSFSSAEQYRSSPVLVRQIEEEEKKPLT
jgi:hypothetical protein